MDMNQGLDVINAGIERLTKKLERGESECEFHVEEYIKFYRTVYKLCTQRPPHNYQREVYDKYRELMEQYITSKVLPALKKK